MTTETNAPKHTLASQAEPAQEEFISFSDIVRMILKHRLKIAVFVGLVTIISAVFFLLSPRTYTAEGFMQVIPPVTTIDEKIDRDMFETIIISHIQTIQSAFITKEVADAINHGQPRIPVPILQQQMKIVRPPKSNLITLTASAKSPDLAVGIVQLWIEKYLASMHKNNINIALSQVRSMLKKTQAGLMETQAKAAQLKTIAEQTKPLIDLARGIDNNQLWRELADNAAAEKINSLSKIHIQGQEQNSEYLTVKTMYYNADQALVALNANLNFLIEVENYLQYKTTQDEKPLPAPAQFSSNSVLFAETMLKATDLIQVGEPALKKSQRGALRKTLIVFVASLCIASFCGYLCEWCKAAKI